MSITVSKTTNVLIEAARVLFIRNGYDHTTMTDIAREAKKGRRTLYVHFPSKEVLLRRVIEMELNKILDVLRAIADKDIPADKKIMEFVVSRLNNVRHTIFRNVMSLSDVILMIHVLQMPITIVIAYTAS